MKKLLPILLAAFTTLPAAAAAPAAGDIILSQSNGSGPSTIRVIPATAGTLPTGALMHSGSNVFAAGTLPLTMGGTGQTSASTAIQSFLDTISTTQGTILYRGASSWAALSPGTSGQVLRTGGASANPSWATVSGTGTVTSVGASGPTGIFTWSSAITASGTLTATLATQSANTVLAGPTTGSAATPAFRALVAADIPDLSGTYATVAHGEVNVKDYGATGDARMVTDAVTTNTDATVTSATAAFTADDIGKVVWGVEQSASAPYGYKCVIGTVASINSATSIEVSAAATRTATGVYLVIGTDDTTACQAAVTAALADGKKINFPGGGYIIAADLGLGANSGIDVIGDGTEATTVYVSPNYDWSSIANNTGALFGGAYAIENMTLQGTNWPTTFEIPAGSFDIGSAYTIVTAGTTNFVAIGAADNNPGTTFTATGAGSGTGTATRFAPTYSAVLAGAVMSNVNITRFNGYTYGLKTLSANADFEHLQVSHCSYIGIYAGGSATDFSDSYVGNCGYYSMQVVVGAGLANTGTRFVWRGGIIDESGTGSLAVDTCTNGDIAFTNTEFLGPQNGYAVTLTASAVKFTGCNIIPYTTGNRGGLSVDATSTAYLSNCRLSGDGTKFAILNSGTVYDGGNVTVEGTGLSGSAMTYGMATTATVAKGGTGATTAAGARVNLLPSLTGNSLKVLRANAGETDYELATISTGLTIGSTAITSGTAGRLLFEGAGNVVSEDSDLSFSTDTLTVTKIAATTMTGALTQSTAVAASTPPVYLTGALYTGGTGTTTFPAIFHQPTGATAYTSWSSGANNGTVFGANEAASFAGNFAEFVVAGSSKVKIDANGTYIRAGNASNVAVGSAAGNGIVFATSPSSFAFISGGTYKWFVQSDVTRGMVCASDVPLSFVGNTSAIAAAPDVAITRDGAGIIKIYDLVTTTNPAKLRIYGTSSGSKYLSLTHDGTNAVISASSGTVNVTTGGLTIGASGTAITKIKHGTATLSSGAATVSDSDVAAGSRIFVNRQADGGTVGDSYSIVISAGSQFTITSKTANATVTGDTSTVSWIMFNP